MVLKPAWWYYICNPTLASKRQEEHEYKARLSYIVTHSAMYNTLMEVIGQRAKGSSL